MSPVLFFIALAALALNGGNDWPTYGGTYANTRYTEAGQIDRSNVARLAPAWTTVLGPAERLETTPIVEGRTMYATTGIGNTVVALDAATGQKKWRYRPSLGPMAACCGLINRGVAVAGGRVFLATLDARLIALDASTGKPVWTTRIGSPAEGLSETMAPLAWNGLVFIGSSGGDYGLRGSLSAYHADTGKLAWRWYAVSQGWEGAYVPSVHGMSLHRDIALEKRSAPLYRNAWAHGGGAVWVTPALDPKTGTIFAATGNPSPVFDPAVRPGDNLYTDSIVAIDARTGKLRWAYQQTPHDAWEYEGSSQPVLCDVLDAHGHRIPAVADAGKTRWIYVLDRRSGKLLRLSENLAPGIDVYGKPPASDPPGALPLRGSIGTVSYDPSRHVVYFSGIENSQDDPDPPKAQTWSDMIAAVNVDTGRIGWTRRFGTYAGDRGDAFIPGTLAAPGLVFASDHSGRLLALDPGTGTVLWQYALGTTLAGDAEDGFFAKLAHRLSDFILPLKRLVFRQAPPVAATADVNTAPISYEIAGRQYIAIPFNAAPERATAGAEITAFALSKS